MPNKLYMALTPFAYEGPDKPIQVLRVGKWNFKEYGPVNISTQDVADYVANFKANVRRGPIPVNIEHRHELGAVGWVKDMVLSEDGTKAYVIPDWTARGRELVQSDSFRFTSPELYPNYRDDESGKEYKNVLSGVAVTNYPRFKEMQQIAANEDAEINAILLSEANEPASDLGWLDQVFASASDTATKQELRSLVFAAVPRSPRDISESLAAILSDLLRSNTLNPKKGETGTDPVIPPVTPPSPALTGEVAHMFGEMQTRIAAAEARATLAETTSATLTQQFSEQQAMLLAERKIRVTVECQSMLAKAQREGRINKEQAAEYATKLPDMVDEMRAMWFADISTRPVALPLGQVGGDAPSDRDPDDDQHTKLAERSQQLFSEAQTAKKPITQREALRLAATEFQSKGLM